MTGEVMSLHRLLDRSLTGDLVLLRPMVIRDVAAELGDKTVSLKPSVWLFLPLTMFNMELLASILILTV